MTKKILDYWKDNYPESCEAIAFLSDLMDKYYHDGDDATCSYLDYAIGAMRKMEDRKKINANTTDTIEQLLNSYYEDNNYEARYREEDCASCMTGSCTECAKPFREEAEKCLDALEILKQHKWHNLLENPNDLPTKNGWYYCWLKTDTIDYGMDLYYYPNHTFIDNRRKNVFELYDVMGTTLDKNGFATKEKMFNDNCVNRTVEVVAWCECPNRPAWLDKEE